MQHQFRDRYIYFEIHVEIQVETDVQSKSKSKSMYGSANRYGCGSEPMHGSASGIGFTYMSASDSTSPRDSRTATHRTFISVDPHHISAGRTRVIQRGCTRRRFRAASGERHLILFSPAPPAPHPRAPGTFISVHRIPSHARGRLLTRVRDRPLAVSVRVRRSRSRLPFLCRRLRRA